MPGYNWQGYPQYPNTVAWGSLVKNPTEQEASGLPNGGVSRIINSGLPSVGGPYISDTFTGTDGTNLASHTPDVGGAWAGPTSNFVLTSNTTSITAGFTSMTSTTNATAMGSADFDLSLDILANAATAGGDWLGVMGRGVPGAGNFYAAYYNANYSGTAQEVRLSKFAGNAETILGTSALAYAQGVTHNLKLRFQGTTISVLIDGVSVISLTDATYTGGTTVGVIGATTFNMSLAIDNFLATDVVSGGPATVSGAIGMSASSGMTVAATVTEIATVLESAAAGMTVAAKVTEVASVTEMAAAGALVVGVVLQLGTTALSATAAMTVVASVTEVASVSQSATAGMTIGSLVAQPAAVAMAATTTLSIVGTGIEQAAVAMAATAALSVSATVVEQAAVSMAAVAAMTVAATTSGTGPSVALTATAGLTAAGQVAEFATVVLTAASTLTTAAKATQLATAGLSAISTLTVTAANIPIAGAVAMAAVATLRVAAQTGTGPTLGDITVTVSAVYRVGLADVLAPVCQVTLADSPVAQAKVLTT